MEDKKEATGGDSPRNTDSRDSSGENPSENQSKNDKVVEKGSSETDASAAEPLVVQNGEIEQTTKVLENGDHNKTDSSMDESDEQVAGDKGTKETNEPTSEDKDKKETSVQIAEDNDEKGSDEAIIQDKESHLSSEKSTTDKSEEKPTRATRGTKRKANDTFENESTINSTSNETTEQKENLEMKNNNVHKPDNSVDDAVLKSMSFADGMGKGKRARVPNKRYSDIILSPNRKSLSMPKSINDGVEIKQEKEEIVVTPLVTSVSSPGLPKRGRGTPREELQDPKYLKPFKYGWRRELVWRSTSTSDKKIGDIYYYNPEGKKVRSFRELADHLTGKHLSLDNFSYAKELLGVNDPEKEIERNAKIAPSQMEHITNSPTPQKVEPVKVKKVETPKVTEPAEIAKVDTPKQTTRGRGRKKVSAPSPEPIVKKKKEQPKDTPTPVNSKMVRNKVPPAKKIKLSKKSEEAVVEPKPAAQPARSSPRKTSKPCSMDCEVVPGIIPTLQCRVCLCLYHHECVGLSPGMGFPYVCKDCREENNPITNATTSTPLVSLPPLTPINTLKSVTASISTTLPKLQRIPREDLVEPLPPTLPSIQALNPLVETSLGVAINESSKNVTTTACQITQPPVESCRSLVGSVTSWLPHNARIVNSEEPAEAPRPQNVEYIGGRKFLVIPKHNVMSVSSGGSFARSEDSITPNVLQATELPLTSASLGPRETTEDVNRESAPKAKEKQVIGNDGSSKLEESDNKNEALPPPSTPQPQVQPKPVKKSLKLKNLTAHDIRTHSTEDKAEAKTHVRDSAFVFDSLLHVFQYLKVQDLLRASCVCRMWRSIANESILWNTVRMKNSQVHSFEGLANALRKHGTVHLDLRKMLLPSSGDDIWPEFSKAIARVDSLKKIEFCRCPASVVERLASSNTNLEVFNAVTIKCDTLDLDPFKSLTCIRELRLKSTSGLNVKSIDSLRELKTLKILSLTSVMDLHKLNLSVIGELANLESLDLGECSDFPSTFGQDILLKLDKLEKLRLEKGQGNCHTFEILESVKNMKRLEQLELVNFDVKPGFDNAIGECKNIKKLMIIPTYISQSATTNNMVLAGVLRLQGTLSNFVWGVTLELLRVTELFVDQCEETSKKEKKQGGNGDCIPVLKPVPDLSNGSQIQAANHPPQVEILPLPNLQKLLLNSLPTTRVKILKIPFHATWRQTLTDSL